MMTNINPTLSLSAQAKLAASTSTGECCSFEDLQSETRRVMRDTCSLSDLPTMFKKLPTLVLSFLDMNPVLS
jgi:hypothetical protein